MASKYVRVPRNAAIIGTIEAILPGGDTVTVDRYESRTRSVPTQWVVHSRLDPAGRRRVRLAEQYSGRRVAAVDREWAESITLIGRQATHLTVKGRTEITDQDVATRSRRR